MQITNSLTDKQLEAYELAKSPARFILFRGGSRSGKTFATLFFIIIRCLVAPNSRHGIFRHTAVDARRTLFDLTFKKVLEKCFPDLAPHLVINQTEMTVQFPNGSLMTFNGLDDSTRVERILGDQFTTVFVNEVSQFKSFDIIQKLMSRLSEEPFIHDTGKRMKPKLFMDCNPPSKRHWTYKAFIEKVHPISGEGWNNPHEWAEMLINPSDNAENISSTYEQDLENNLTRREKTRFLEGEWQTDNDNAMFNIDKVNANRHKPRAYDDVKDFVTIVVAVDPATSSHDKSDETGIIVAGINEDGHCFVLDDCSLKAKPQQWGDAAVKAYERWNASYIVAEKNQGGEMVSHTIRTVNPTVPVKLVHASRGKVIRAEPVSALYEQNMVHHCGYFDKLEAQLEDFTVDFNRTRDGSPDRVDALVWAISELAVKVTKDYDGRQGRLRGFW